MLSLETEPLGLWMWKYVAQDLLHYLEKGRVI